MWLWLVVSTALGQSIDFTSSVTFGDSLTHDSGAGSDEGPHERVFLRNSAFGDVLTDYAVSGDTSWGLVDQIGLYRDDAVDSTVDRATFVGLQIGVNDLIDHLGVLTANGPGDPAADAVVDDITANIQTAARWVATRHPDAIFVLWTIPDATQTPALWGLPTDQAANLVGHIEAINDGVLLTDGHPVVTVFDAFTELNELAASPPVLRGVPVGVPPDYGASTDMFKDTLHPSPLGYSLIANLVMSHLNDELGTSLDLYTEDELADIAGIP